MHLTGIYSTFGGSKYILSDRGSQFTSKKLTFLASELGFIKLYTSPYPSTSNSIIECTHSFLKAYLRKLISNHQIDCDGIAHITAIVYNVFPHSSAGEAPIYLMFGHNPFMPTLFKLLIPKLRYMCNEKYRITSDTMQELYMMAGLNLEMASDRCPLPIRDPDKIDFKIGDMVLIKNHTPKDTFDSKYQSSFRICKKTLDKAFDVQDSAGK